MDSAQYHKLIQEYQKSKSENRRALITVARVLALTFLGMGISLLAWPSQVSAHFPAHLVIWAFGQGCLGLSFLQWFILIHDLGHNRFFKKTIWNDIVGHFASLLIILPFYPWRYIHAHHHVWTGWRDLDPTMTSLPIKEISPGKRALIDFCWKWWVPLFSLAFSFQNFWNLKKLKRIWSRSKERKKFYFSIALLIGTYVGLLVFFGGRFFLKDWLPAYMIFLILSDPLLISQHSGIRQNKSEGKRVAPFSPWEQDVFTRSLLFPRWVREYVLLNFDNHAVHHYFPTLPCYHLGKVRLKTIHAIFWLTWLKRAKKTPAHVLLFNAGT